MIIHGKKSSTLYNVPSVLTIVDTTSGKITLSKTALGNLDIADKYIGLAEDGSSMFVYVANESTGFKVSKTGLVTSRRYATLMIEKLCPNSKGEVELAVSETPVSLDGLENVKFYELTIEANEDTNENSPSVDSLESPIEIEPEMVNEPLPEETTIPPFEEVINLPDEKKEDDGRVLGDLI